MLVFVGRRVREVRGFGGWVEVVEVEVGIGVGGLAASRGWDVAVGIRGVLKGT